MKTRLLPLLLAAFAAFAAALPAPAWARHGHAPPPGRVLVVNQSGGTVTVSVDGRSSRTLAPWQTADLPALAGDAWVSATYTQFGQVQVLQASRVRVPAGRATSLVLAPETIARVLVTNDSPHAARLTVDGRPGDAFAPGEDRVIALPVGRVELAMVAGTRTLERATLSLRAFAESRWVVNPPRTGDLVVSNPLPIPVQLVCDKGLVRTVAPHGTTTYVGLPAGPFHLTARRTTGETIDDERAGIVPGAVAGWRVDPPRTGLVNLDSAHFVGTAVRLDGRPVAALAAGAEARVEARLGWHEVSVVDELGRVVLTTWIEVEPYAAVDLAFGTPAHVPATSSRDDRRAERERRGYDHPDRDAGYAYVDGETVAEAGSGCAMPR